MEQQEGQGVEIAGLNKILRFIIRDSISLNMFIARCMGSLGTPPQPMGEDIGWQLTPMDNIKINSRPDKEPAGTISFSVFRGAPSELDEALVSLVEALLPEALEWVQKEKDGGKLEGLVTKENITYLPGCEPSPEDPDNLEV